MAHKFVKAIPVVGTEQFQLLLQCGSCGEEFKSRPMQGRQIGEMLRRRSICTCKQPNCRQCSPISEQ